MQKIAFGIIAAGIMSFGIAASAQDETAFPATSSVEAPATGSINLVPAEVQQQLDSAQQKIDIAAKTAQSVKEKGITQTLWDGFTAPFAAVFAQIGQIFSSIGSILGINK